MMLVIIEAVRASQELRKTKKKCQVASVAAEFTNRAGDAMTNNVGGLFECCAG